MTPPIDTAALRRTAAAKYGEPPPGWGPAMRQRFGYYTPDDVYETLVDHMITPGCRWLDVGCGRDVFPTNPALAKNLSERCGTLVGVDPNPTIHENPFLHSRVQGQIEDVQPTEAFEIITSRMVVEHVGDPPAFVRSLRQICAPRGCVVIYTVNKRAPVSIVAWFVPFIFHRHVASLLWGRGHQDSFPVEYRMNTRRELTRLMREAGFEERNFKYLDDCRTFARFRWSSFVELVLWKCLRAVGLHYPETCLLAVYQRADD